MKLDQLAIALAAFASASLMPVSNPCSYGLVASEFNTPAGGNGNLLYGTLLRANGSTVAFNLFAHTHNEVSTDPTKRVGILHGFLYYGAPVGTPDFTFYGHWELEIATGQGVFYAPIYEQDQVFIESCGRLGGTLFEPPGDPTPSMGSMVGQWGMCL